MKTTFEATCLHGLPALVSAHTRMQDKGLGLWDVYVFCERKLAAWREVVGRVGLL